MGIKVNEFVIQAQSIQRNQKSNIEETSVPEAPKITGADKNKDDVLIGKCLDAVKEYLDREYNIS